jgi:hypothetical protein
MAAAQRVLGAGAAGVLLRRLIGSAAKVETEIERKFAVTERVLQRLKDASESTARRAWTLPAVVRPGLAPPPPPPPPPPHMDTKAQTPSRADTTTQAAADRTTSDRRWAATYDSGVGGARTTPLVHQVTTTSFLDTYYDTDTYDLTRHDLWLRQRDHTWELKWPGPLAASLSRALPSVSVNGSSTSGATAVDEVTVLSGVDHYRESRDWPTIAATVHRLTGVRLRDRPSASRPSSIPATSATRTTPVALDDASYDARGTGSVGDARCFARIHTERTRHVLSAGDVAGVTTVYHVDIDRVHWHFRHDDAGGDAGAADYMVGEVELVPVSGAWNVSYTAAQAAQLLAEVFAWLGIDRTPVRGKVLEYLSRHRPAHYAALVQCGLVASKLH